MSVQVVIGDGAMGTVCSQILASKGGRVRLWGHSAEQIRQFREANENTRFLPGYQLLSNIELTAEEDGLFDDAELIISAVPCKYLRGVWSRLAEHIPNREVGPIPVVSVTKGIENYTFLRPTEIIVELTGSRPVAALSGPNIADEVARRLPATSTIASRDDYLAQYAQTLLSTSWLRIYTNKDVVGVELAGATKNVIAIAAGILDGMSAGHNAKAALLTRGLVEISRLGEVMGASLETFSGLSGMGDLITTCYSHQGRNRTFGELIGRGRTVEQAVAEIPGEVEGINTCKSLSRLSKKHQVEMPITRSIHDVLFESKPILKALDELMTRRLKPENVEADTPV